MDILNNFGVQTTLLAAQIVNFLILLFLLKKFLYKPILKVLDARKEKIAMSLKDVEEIEKRLKEATEEGEKIIQKATLESKKIIEDSQKSGISIIEEAKEKASSEVSDMIKKGREQLAQERERIMKEARENIMNLVTLALEKTTGKVLTKKDQSSIIGKSIKEIT